MQNFFSTGRRRFLTGGKGGLVVKSMAKNMGANMVENLERGPFGVFRGTILNGGRPHSRPPKEATVLYYIDL